MEEGNKIIKVLPAPKCPDLFTKWTTSKTNGPLSSNLTQNYIKKNKNWKTSDLRNKKKSIVMNCKNKSNKKSS